MKSLEIKYLDIDILELNKGQVPGLPSNPRQWTKKELTSLAKSLKETPELFKARPILCYPQNNGHYVALGGNLRLEASRLNKIKQVPAIVFDETTPLDTLKAIIIKDNGSFGSWDYDELANSWDDLPLVEWGVPAWDTGQEDPIEDVDMEEADYNSAKLQFHFSSDEYSWVVDCLSKINANKEKALLQILKYEDKK